MANDSRWRQTELPRIVRIGPSADCPLESDAFNRRVLSDWGVPEESRYVTGQQGATGSALGDANVNMTVWFLTVSLLVEEACRRGVAPAESQFIDVGCGVGLAALYAVEAHGFKSAVGLEHDARWVHEANDLISSASVSASSKGLVSIVHADAATYRLSPSVGEGRFIFIFNAFGEHTLRAFIRNNANGFTSGDVIALANDVTLLEPLVDALPGCAWLRNDLANSSLVFPSGHSDLTEHLSNRTIL